VRIYFVVVAGNKSFNVSSGFRGRAVGFVTGVLFGKVLFTDALYPRYNYTRPLSARLKY
jgi:hypothetical protein